MLSNSTKFLTLLHNKQISISCKMRISIIQLMLTVSLSRRQSGEARATRRFVTRSSYTHVSCSRKWLEWRDRNTKRGTRTDCTTIFGTADVKVTNSTSVHLRDRATCFIHDVKLCVVLTLEAYVVYSWLQHADPWLPTSMRYTVCKESILTSVISTNHGTMTCSSS